MGRFKTHNERIAKKLKQYQENLEKMKMKQVAEKLKEKK